MLFKVKSYLVDHPEVAQDQSRWIIGMGWNQTNWPGGEFPSAVCAATFAKLSFCLSLVCVRRRQRMTLSVNLFFVVAVSCSCASTVMHIGSLMQSSRNFTIFQTRSMGVSSYVTKPGIPLVRIFFLSRRPLFFPLSGHSEQACLSIMQCI